MLLYYYIGTGACPEGTEGALSPPSLPRILIVNKNFGHNTHIFCTPLRVIWYF